MNQETATPLWREPLTLWLAIAGLALILGWIFSEGLALMEVAWATKEEYGYGYLIPLIATFFIWQKKNVLEKIPFQGSWFGIFLVLAGLFGFLMGELSTLYIIIQYSFILTLFGVVLSLVGWRGIAIIWAPLVLLVFAIPLPTFLYQGLSSQLQLISSELGVAIIRLFGISVNLQGNIIDLGVYKLQVVEACSGLRYLFPLASLAFMAGYIFKGENWKRVLIFLSSIPISIFMNSFRIGMIGILVEIGGIEQAEGFLHYFEGWVIFMACMALLITEMWVLGKIGPNACSLADSFNLEFPDPAPEGASFRSRKMPGSLIVAGILLVGAVAASSTYSIDDRQEIIPDRLTFATFPSRLGGWIGSREQMDQVYIDQLQFDDYITANYISEDGDIVSLYMAYYGSQRKGVSAHSPRSCIPGGGWRITSIEEKTLEDVSLLGKPLKVNRVVVKSRDSSQLLYYWFQQRDRNVTNEYLVKWYLFWDSLTRQRTDGALIRLTAYVAPGADMVEAEQRLTAFSKELVGTLTVFVPD